MCCQHSLRTKNSLRVLLCLPMKRQFKRWVTVDDLNDNGLGYVAAAGKKAGADIMLLGWNVNLSMDDFQQKLLELRPHIVGIKVFTTHFKETRETLRCIRETLSDAITLIGGPHPSTSRPEDLFVEFDGLLDYAIAGDGEYGIASLIEKVRVAGGKPDVKSLAGVPGLIYRNNDTVCSNKPCFDAELDTLAPLDWSLQQPAWFKSSLGLVKDGSTGALIMDSRGCPAQCDFCKCSLINGSQSRQRSLKLLCAEIEELVHKYGVRVLSFTGNSFLTDADYVRELCRWLIAFDTPLKWSCTGAAYVYNLQDQKLLELMSRAGCVLIYFGIESANSEIRKRLHQPISLMECTETVKLTVASGIRAGCTFMFGFPDETVKEMNDTISYALSLSAYADVGFLICLPLPGTSCYNAVLEKYGLDRIDWSTYNFSNPNLLPCKASLSQVRRKFYEGKLLERSRLARHLYRLKY